MLEWKFKALNAFYRKEEIFKINDLYLEKDKHINTKKQ